MCASALVEIDLELQLADDWINLSDKKRKERRQQARQLLLSLFVVILGFVSMHVALAAPAVGVFALCFHARIKSMGRPAHKPTQMLNVGGHKVDIVGSVLRAGVTMLLAMGCLSVSLGHIAGPWITAEVHEHLLTSADTIAADPGNPHDVHGHVHARLKADNVSNVHLRHLMHVHDTIRVHAANGTSVKRGLGHHMKTIGHVVGASAEVAKLIGKGVQESVKSGIANTKRAASHRRKLKQGVNAVGHAGEVSAGGADANDVAASASTESEPEAEEAQAEAAEPEPVAGGEEGADTATAGAGGDGAEAGSADAEADGAPDPGEEGEPQGDAADQGAAEDGDSSAESAEISGEDAEAAVDGEAAGEAGEAEETGEATGDAEEAAGDQGDQDGGGADGEAEDGAADAHADAEDAAAGEEGDGAGAPEDEKEV